MFGILGLGFLIGMQHALEADHIAAVSSIAARRTSVRDIVRHGLTWGFGHTLTLFVFAGAAILLGKAIPEHLERPIEAAVGVMLVGLGAHVLWRLWRDHMALEYRHGHRSPVLQIHGAPGHENGLRWRTLTVGLIHGMAGSAALIVLTASQAGSPTIGLLYILLFGVGSMLGMGALSTVIAVPIAASARWLTWANRGLQVAVGLVTITIGAMTIYEKMLAT